MSQVRTLVSVHQGQAVEALHSVGGHSSTAGDVVLGVLCHLFQQLSEADCLNLAGEVEPCQVGLPNLLLKH